MRAEIAKVRYLPLPRVVAGIAFLTALLPGMLLLIFQPRSSGVYLVSSSLTNSMVLEVLAIVVGAWVATVDVASGTLQRTLTAESDRHRVLAAKLLVGGVFVLLLSVAAAAVAGGLVDLAMGRAGLTDRPELARQLATSAPTTLGGFGVGFGFGLLTRSLGGGITVGVVFSFVLSGFVSFVPHASAWFYSSLTGDLSNRISTVGVSGIHATAEHALLVSMLGTLAWIVAVILPGWALFVRGDLK